MTTKRKDMKAFLLVIRKAIHRHAQAVPTESRREPKSIIESRFTSAHDAFDAGMLSCGSMANIPASILRNLGFQVKLVHGECANSVDHAWIAVLDLENGVWVEYDFTQEDLEIPETHIKKTLVDSWSEIRNQILSDHNTMKYRREERGLIPTI